MIEALQNNKYSAHNDFGFQLLLFTSTFKSIELSTAHFPLSCSFMIICRIVMPKNCHCG